MEKVNKVDDVNEMDKVDKDKVDQIKSNILFSDNQQVKYLAA